MAVNDGIVDCSSVTRTNSFGDKMMQTAGTRGYRSLYYSTHSLAIGKWAMTKAAPAALFQAGLHAAISPAGTDSQH